MLNVKMKKYSSSDRFKFVRIEKGHPYHIFKAKVVDDKCFLSHGESCCGGIEFEGDKDDVLSGCYDKEGVKKKAVEKGAGVCANCIKTFYANDNK